MVDFSSNTTRRLLWPLVTALQTETENRPLRKVGIMHSGRYSSPEYRQTYRNLDAVAEEKVASSVQIALFQSDLE